MSDEADEGIDPGEASGTVEAPPAPARGKPGPKPGSKRKRRAKRARRPLEPIADRLVPGDDEAPGDVGRAPGRRDRAPLRGAVARNEARKLREGIAQLIQVANVGYSFAAPCTCEPDLRVRGAHRDTCPQTFGLTPDEAAQVIEALAAEFEAHPGLSDQLDRFRSWAPHIALAMALFAIVQERRSRAGVILEPPEGWAPSPNMNGHAPAEPFAPAAAPPDYADRVEPAAWGSNQE